MPTRFYKVFRDLTSDSSKSLMLVLSIALGVFGIGTILGSYSVVQREMKDNYMNTVPASATIEVDSAISKEVVDSIKSISGIIEAERHASVVARMKVGEKWYPLLLFVIDDFENKKTNKYNLLSGAANPTEGSMLVERTAYGMMQAKEGDELLIKTANGNPQKIKLTGTVHDAGLAPAWQEQAGYGYISLTTLQALGETQGFDQLRVLVSEQTESETHIQECAQKAASLLKSQAPTPRTDDNSDAHIYCFQFSHTNSRFHSSCYFDLHINGETNSADRCHENNWCHLTADSRFVFSNDPHGKHHCAADGGSPK